MKPSHARGWSGPQWLVAAGCAMFIFILALSAYFEADIRWLHFVQSLMYVGALVLVHRRNRWGYFIGFSAAAFWDYANLFVTSFFFNGLHWLSVSLTSWRFERVDQIIAVPAWFGNLLVVLGCAWGYARLPRKRARDAGRFVFAFLLTTAFFAADVALFQPRYLAILRGALHPHRTWVR